MVPGPTLAEGPAADSLFSGWGPQPLPSLPGVQPAAGATGGVSGPGNSSPRTLPPGNLPPDGPGNLRQVRHGPVVPVSGWPPAPPCPPAISSPPGGPRNRPRLRAEGTFTQAWSAGPRGGHRTSFPRCSAARQPLPASKTPHLAPRAPRFQGASSFPFSPRETLLAQGQAGPSCAASPDLGGGTSTPETGRNARPPRGSPTRDSSPPVASSLLLWPLRVSAEHPPNPERTCPLAHLPWPGMFPSGLPPTPVPLPPAPSHPSGAGGGTCPSGGAKPRSHRGEESPQREAGTRGQGARTPPPPAAGGGSGRGPALLTTRKPTG